MTQLLSKVFILSDNYRLLLATTTSPSVRAAGIPVYVDVIKGPRGNVNRYLLDKIMALNLYLK